MTGDHRGRIAMLRRAAELTAPVSSSERDVLIRLGARGRDREYVLAELKRYAELRKNGIPFEAEELLEALAGDPQPPEGDAA